MLRLPNDSAGFPDRPQQPSGRHYQRVDKKVPVSSFRATISLSSTIISDPHCNGHTFNSATISPWGRKRVEINRVTNRSVKNLIPLEKMIATRFYVPSGKLYTDIIFIA